MTRNDLLRPVTATVGLLALLILGSHTARADYFSEVMADGPMGYWRFEETGGLTAGDITRTAPSTAA